MVFTSLLEASLTTVAHYTIRWVSMLLRVALGGGGVTPRPGPTLHQLLGCGLALA